jgi:hypothetical protein
MAKNIPFPHFSIGFSVTLFSSIVATGFSCVILAISILGFF